MSTLAITRELCSNEIRSLPPRWSKRLTIVDEVSLYDSKGKLAIGPWLQAKLGDKGAKALAFFLLSPYLLFAIRGFMESR
jgi:hypothetical protein